MTDRCESKPRSATRSRAPGAAARTPRRPSGPANPPRPAPATPGQGRSPRSCRRRNRSRPTLGLRAPSRVAVCPFCGTVEPEFDAPRVDARGALTAVPGPDSEPIAQTDAHWWVAMSPDHPAAVDGLRNARFDDVVRRLYVREQNPRRDAWVLSHPERLRVAPRVCDSVARPVERFPFAFVPVYDLRE